MKSLFFAIVLALCPSFAKAQVDLTETFSKDQLLAGVEVVPWQQYSDASAQFKLHVYWNQIGNLPFPIDLHCGGVHIMRVWTKLDNQYINIYPGRDILGHCPAASNLTMHVQAMNFEELYLQKSSQLTATHAASEPALGTSCLNADGHVFARGQTYAQRQVEAGQFETICTDAGESELALNCGNNVRVSDSQCRFNRDCSGPIPLIRHGSTYNKRRCDRRGTLFIDSYQCHDGALSIVNQEAEPGMCPERRPIGGVHF